MSQGGDSARADLKGGAGWMLFGLVIFVAAWRMDRFESMGATLYTAPGLVPGIFGLLLIALGAVLAWRGRRAVRAGGAEAAAEPLLNRRIVLMFALCLGYAVVLVGHANFALATALFVAAFTWLYAETDATAMRRSVVALASGVLTAIVIVLVFERVFLVRLP